MSKKLKGINGVQIFSEEGYIDQLSLKNHIYKTNDMRLNENISRNTIYDKTLCHRIEHTTNLTC